MMGAATEICPPEGGRYACKSEGEMAVTRLGLTRAIVSAAAVTATASLLFASAPRFARAPSRAQEQAQGSEADSKAIKQVFAEFYESFSRHDAHAAAMTFAEDADFTNMRGVHNHGRKEIEAHLAMIFAGNLGSARRTDMVKSIRFVTPAIAEVDADTVISGTKAADGSSASSTRWNSRRLPRRDRDELWREDHEE